MSALSYATAQLLRVLPRERVTRVMGKLADHAWSPPLGRAVVALYSRAYGVSLAECDEAEWRSFDAFFTRELRDGARPIDRDAQSIVSPADGRIDSMGPIGPGSTFLVKGRTYRLEELLGNDEEAARYRGGSSAVIYLSPRDYHRVHSPVAGTLRSVRSMPGDYFPVNDVGVQHVPNLFAINRRVAICIDTPASAGLGRVTVVMVAAIVVGRITVTGISARDVPYGDHAIDPIPVDRGDELGMFHLGSTVVLFFEKGASLRWQVGDGPVRYGQRIAAATVAAPSPRAEAG